MNDTQKRRLAELLVASGAVRFGQFVTKSGRPSPYFVNLGDVSDGAQLSELGELYAAGIDATFGAAGVTCVFGPAYKGIPLAVSAAQAAARAFGRPVRFSFDRKEVKDHGEGGRFVGHVPGADDRVLIVDDVITDGGAKRAAIELLQTHTEAQIVGLLVAVDRMERGRGERTALTELSEELGLVGAALITIEELVAAVRLEPSARDAVLAHVARNRALGV